MTEDRLLMDSARTAADRLDTLAAKANSLAEGQRLAMEASRLRGMHNPDGRPMPSVWGVFRN